MAMFNKDYGRKTSSVASCNDAAETMPFGMTQAPVTATQISVKNLAAKTITFEIKLSSDTFGGVK